MPPSDSDWTLSISGLTIDLPGRDEAFGRRVAKVLQEALADLDLGTSVAPAAHGAGPLDLTMPAAASEHEIVRSIMAAVGASLGTNELASSSAGRSDLFAVDRRADTAMPDRTKSNLAGKPGH